jgi:hypothetical protein
VEVQNVALTYLYVFHFLPAINGGDKGDMKANKTRKNNKKTQNLVISTRTSRVAYRPEAKACV